MSMRALDELREKFCDELDEIARKDEMSAGDLEAVHKLTDTIKNIDKICIMDEDGGYSQAGDWEARGHFGDRYARERGYNEDGNSYAGRHRDSMGRYSREGRGGDYSRRGRGGRGYSRDGGKEEMMEHVEILMDAATTEEERQAVKRFKKQLEDL